MSQYDSANGREPVERKVQLAGNSTFVVSLPKEWALAQELESGMSMHLYPHEDRVVASAEPVPDADRSATVDAAAVDDETVLRRVRSAYVVGRLVGVEIVEDTGERMVVRDLLDVDDVSLPQTIVQTRQLALEMHADALEALARNDEELARRVIDRDDEVDRLFAFVSRGFNRGLEDVLETIEELDRRLSESDDPDAYRYGTVLESLRRTASIAGNVLEVTSEATVDG
ncbi:PhoU domain-containing protein [Natronococcus sp.]|uniref:PhoU domain-containing protein n=1 Tax=Natronococcus sp. TaxID=35747 RepID=UPI003A4DB9E2